MAAQEFFRPGVDPIEPLGKLVRENAQDRQLPIRPIDFIFELICSEVFFITSPANIPAATNAYAELLQRFGIGTQGSLKGVELSEMIRKDADEIAKACGMIPQYVVDIQNSQERLFRDFPRRSILLVPACTTRPEDFYLLGQTFHVAASGCVVFCNAVDSRYGSGGSCLIGHLSWNNKHSEFSPAGKHDLREDGSPERSNEEIVIYGENISPYHGLLPGIYLGEKHPIAGPLGKEDQALVIVDIDPIYLSEGRPRPQLLPTPQRLVAHLPIFEMEVIDGEWKKMENSTKLRDALDDLESTLNSASGQASTADGAHADDLYRALRKLAESEEKNRKDWLLRRANHYREFHQQQPTSWPPPVVVDWLLVEHDFSRTGLKKVHVPPLSQSLPEPKVSQKASSECDAE